MVVPELKSLAVESKIEMSLFLARSGYTSQKLLNENLLEETQPLVTKKKEKFKSRDEPGEVRFCLPRKDSKLLERFEKFGHSELLTKFQKDEFRI